ncbi:monooxygenase [Streptomyces kurssanovii]|nr:monooxygenase [Streptomyces kurssanovii]
MTPTAPHTPRTPRLTAPSADARRHTLLRTARDVADDLAADADARDQAGEPPADETARLREAGVLAALTPPGPDRGTDWSTACAVVQEIATADSSVGEILARHYVHTWSSRFYGTSTARTAALEGESVRAQWLWTGAVRASGSSDDDEEGDLTLTPLDTGYVLNGRRALDTATTVADQLVVDARCAVTGDILVVRLPRDHQGLTAETGGGRLGQRVAGAGTLVPERVVVAPNQVMGVRPHDEESTALFTALATPALRLALCHVGLGIVEGSLAEARDLSRSASRTSRLPAKDPDLLLAYGELASTAQTASAVVGRATDAMARALDLGPLLDVEEPAAVAALVATAETVTTRAALRVTTRALELADAPGLDRFWRNARVLTAHRSAARRLRAIGDHYLNGPHRTVPATCP